MDTHEIVLILIYAAWASFLLALLFVMQRDIEKLFAKVCSLEEALSTPDAPADAVGFESISFEEDDEHYDELYDGFFYKADVGFIPPVKSTTDDQ